MVYTRGDYKISVEKIDGFGKNPGLWVHKGNQAYKMASFGSEGKAKLFEAYLQWLIFGTEIPEEEFEIKTHDKKQVEEE